MSKQKHIPGTSKKGLLERKSFVEAVSVGPPVIAAIGAAMNAPSVEMAAWLGFGALWLTGASIVKVLHARTQDKTAQRQADHDGLIGALYVLQATVAESCGILGDVDSHLRLTVHRVVLPSGKDGKLADAEEIEQVVDYVGGDGGGGGRRFSVRSGVTGLAIRKGEPCAGLRQSDDEVAYVNELKSQWGYTDQDARKIARGRYSFMAVPIRCGQHVVGVIYLDSDQRDLFTGTEIADQVVAACGGINRYVDWRY